MKKTYFLAALAAAASLCEATAQTVTLDLGKYATPTATRLLRALSAPEDARAPYCVNATYNGDPRSRMGFAWFTNSDTSTGTLQIVAGHTDTADDFATPTLTVQAESRPTGELNYTVPKNNVAGVEPNTKRTYTSHKALATGLTADTEYSWRVGQEGAWSPIGHFRTAADTYADGFDFLYVTDTQAQNDEMFDISQRTLHTAKETVPEAKFVLVNGDLVETYLVESGERWNFDIEDNSEWESEQWFETMSDVWRNTPLVPLQGNHDTSEHLNWWLHFNTNNDFNATAAAPTRMPGTVYSFVQGGVLFMAINYEEWNEEGYFESLAAWMRQQVNAHPEVKWRVATFHKNMFTGSRSHQSDADGRVVREHMLPVFAELNIDVALQGHDHIYEVIGPVDLSSSTLIADEVTCVEMVEGGRRENMTGKEGGVFDVSRGTLFFLNNSAGKKKYEPRTEEEMIAALADHGVENYWGLFSGKFGQTGEPTFSRVHVTDDNINIKTYTVDTKGNANLYDAFDIVKGTGTDINQAKAQEAVKVSVDNAQRVINVKAPTGAAVAVYNAAGAQVAQGAAPQVSTNGLGAGVYVVRVTVDGRNFYGKVQVK